MAGSFTWKRWILAAVLVVGLPSVAPYNFNSCSGGLVAQTCTARFSSHCCKSGIYLSATCCQNSCSEPGSSTGRFSTTTCFGKTNSMCCSTKSLGSESCCNYASYSRTSISSVRGHYERSTYGTCIGNYSTEYCLNRLSTACCTQGELTSATCCRSYPNNTFATCYGYGPGGGGPAIFGLVIGGAVLLVVVIAVPIAVVCCRARKRRGASTTNTTVFALTTNSNQWQPQPAYQQPPPYGSLYPPKFDDIDQPPPYSSLQLQAPAVLQMQPEAPPVYQP